MNPPDTAVLIDQSRLQNLMGYQLTKAELNIHRKFIENTAKFSLRPVDFSILVLIDSNQGIHQRQIGEVLNISPPNLVGVIARLVKRRLLRRVRSKQDKRVQHLYLSKAGAELLQQVETEVITFENQLFASFTEAEQKALKRALEKIMQI